MVSKEEVIEIHDLVLAAIKEAGDKSSFEAKLCLKTEHVLSVHGDFVEDDIFKGYVNWILDNAPKPVINIYNARQAGRTPKKPN